jgi:hypothetical protein
VPALSTPRCSEIPGACVPAVGPTLIMAATSQPMESGDAEDAIPLTQPMFDGDATDNDVMSVCARGAYPFQGARARGR